MGIFSAIKYALNSTVGTDAFRPLDEMIKKDIADKTVIRHIQRGTSQVAQGEGGGTVTISLAGFTNLSKMVVLLNGGGYLYNFYSKDTEYYTRHQPVYMKSLGLTSLEVEQSGWYYRNSSSNYEKSVPAPFSYQVIEFY